MLNRYIVLLKGTASSSDIDKIIADVESAGGKVTHRYGTLGGFAAVIPEPHLRMLQDSCNTADSMISCIEPDSVMRIDS
ncbi:unnamed protein product [Rhizoctonia solani]|uniref:Inhibitor I9 domain-containing protein n=1 Tax=Rhizoctonia solani TaxID=456999 RepID=A0A8H3DZ60_9AGAM|nr:unnamed protein product [Rhizoctonia solani]CAE7081366.1 unnamed protein product [Rhizoctonia solani]